MVTSGPKRTRWWWAKCQKVRWSLNYFFLAMLPVWSVFSVLVLVKLKMFFGRRLKPCWVKVCIVFSGLCWSVCCVLVHPNVTCYTNKSRSSLMGSSVIPAHRHAALSPHPYTATSCQTIRVMNARGGAPWDRRRLCIHHKPSAVKKRPISSLML